MLTKRENFFAILKGEQPDYYGDCMEALAFIWDPVFKADRVPQDGEIHKDTWGVEFVLPPGAPGKHPVGRPEGLVIKDVEEWESQLVVPQIDNLDWETSAKEAEAVDRTESLVAVFSSGGLFERSHHLMSFEEALVNYLTYEDEMVEVLRKIADYKIEYLKLAAKYIKPDVVFFQDDWGSKTNLFLPPDVWRRLIKPLHKEIVDTAHECDILFIHHADCYCEPLAPDMVELGIDIWQGVIPQNDIVSIQEVTGGKLAMQGGINGPAIDIEGISDEAIKAEVHRAIDSYCPAGRFFPGSPSGNLFVEHNNKVFQEEMAAYGREWALAHPVS